MGESYSYECPDAVRCDPPLAETKHIHLTVGTSCRCKSNYKKIIYATVTKLLFHCQAPWEIYRLQIQTNDIIDASRIVDSYTKSGDVGAYSTYFGLVPDYEMGISVLGAGNSPLFSVATIRATLVDIFVREEIKSSNTFEHTG